MSYLIHFNKNHSSKDGRFISGDGDGDGQLNDNKWYKENAGTSNKDSDRLAKTMSRYGNSYASYLDSSKTRYFTDNKGQVLFREDGSPRGMFIHNIKKYDTWKKETQKYLNEKQALQKKYKEVVANANLTDKGESFINVKLTDKSGNTYSTRLRTKYINANFNRHEFAKMYS